MRASGNGAAILAQTPPLGIYCVPLTAPSREGERHVAGMIPHEYTETPMSGLFKLDSRVPLLACPTVLPSLPDKPARASHVRSRWTNHHA